MKRRARTFAFTIAILAALGGCKRKEDPPPGPSGGPPAAAASNRVDIPAPVRENLGITFAKVESRNVARTLRLPGSFELLPEGRREHRAVLPGRIEVLVSQNQRVAAGTPLYRLDAPRWRELKQQLADADASVERARTNAETIAPLKAARVIHADALRDAVELLEKRVVDLERVRADVGGKAEEISAARTELSRTRSDLGEIMEKDAELDARERLAKVDLEAATERSKLLLGIASSLCCAPSDATSSPGTGTRGASAWRSIDVIEVTSASAGVVESVALSTGAWAEEGTLVVRVVEPDRVQFRARALQNRVARLAGVTDGRIVPPRGDDGEVNAGIAARVVLGTALDSSRRALDVFGLPSETAAWARAGAAGFLEVVTRGSTSSELAMPLACVTRDGATAVIFRRDPGDPNKVIRMEADLGIDDGRWIAVKSGVGEGDEIVSNGAWQLMLATSGTAAKGGHFHADGTFHEGHK